MQFLSIRNKLIATVSFSALATGVCVGILSMSKLDNTITKNTVNNTLPETLTATKAHFDNEIDSLVLSSKQLAGNPYISMDFKNGAVGNGAKLVSTLKGIKEMHGLEDVSYVWRADKSYYNQDGFLKRLTPSEDEWYFSMTKGSPNLINMSLFTEVDGTSKLFINRLDPNGQVMTASSMRINEVNELLGDYKLTPNTKVHLVNGEGVLQISNDKSAQASSKIIEEFEGLTLLNDSGAIEIFEATKGDEKMFVAKASIAHGDWQLIMEVPQSEIFADLKAMERDLVKAIGVALFVLTLLGVLFANKLVRPITSISRTFKEIGEGDGDLSTRLELKGDDEITLLSEGFNSFMEKIHFSVSEVSQVANALNEAASVLERQVNATKILSEDQTSALTEARDSVEMMSGTINEIAVNASQAATQTSESNDEAVSSIAKANDGADSMNQLSKGMGEVVVAVDKLAADTQSIEAVLDVIREISDQTNLLALNAAIEAARAGEAGRGFAVVADEVRGLAGRTNSSIDNIQSMIIGLQNGAQEAVEVIGANNALSCKGSELATGTSESLSSIVTSISTINEMNGHVAAATEEQSTVVQAVIQKIQVIDEIGSETNRHTEELAHASINLKGLSIKLDELLRNFKF